MLNQICLHTTDGLRELRSRQAREAARQPLDALAPILALGTLADFQLPLVHKPHSLLRVCRLATFYNVAMSNRSYLAHYRLSC